jgi:cellulose synthase/poly-beta-1,6-N-acetylglucosamine synthase-like glycosyltransferase
VPSITGLSLGILGYTHLGYPALIALLARLSPARVKVDPDYEPMVSVCIPAHDAAAHLQEKLTSIVRQSYAADKIEILVYSDGSTDGTEDIVRAFARQDPRVRLLRGEVCRGKPTALNRMRDVARGEVLVLTDARQPLDPDAVRALVEGLSDPEVACVSGNLLLDGGAGSGFYWRYENWIRKNEARFRSMVGVTGPLTALRKQDLHPVPEDIILDDVWVPMRLRLDGRRVLLREDAVVRDRAFGDDREFQRKVRTLAGNYQVFARMPALLNPLANPSWLETVSHKVMRLISPFALIGLFASTATSLAPGPMPGKGVKQVLLAAQVLAYAAAALGPRAGRVPGIARTFVMMHAAALVGLWRFLSGGQKVTWQLPATPQKRSLSRVQPPAAE